MSKCKLGDLLKIKHGYAFKSENYVKSSKYRLITLGNFSDGNSFKYNDEKATYYGADFPSEFILQEGDLIMPLTEQVVGLFGNTAFVPKTEDYIFVLNQRVGKVIYDEKKVNKYYLHYLLATNSVKQQIEARASGTRQRNISPENVYDVEVDIPEINVQEKIGNLLYLLEEKQINNNKINAELESMAKTIYDYWFLQFEFPNEEGKPYKSSGGKMVWNEELKREIPEGWKVSSLRDKYSIERGLSYTSKDIESEEGIPMINLACIDINRNYRDGELKYHNGKVPEDAMLNSGDLLVACTDLTRNADIVGSPILVPYDDVRYTYSMDIAKLIPSKEYFNQYYLYMTLRTEFYHNYIKKWASGTNVLHLNLDGLNWYTTWIPPMKLQDRYAEIIEDINKKQSILLQENRKLASLRDFLLPLLMNGQVGFKEVTNG